MRSTGRIPSRRVCKKSRCAGCASIVDVDAALLHQYTAPSVWLIRNDHLIFIPQKNGKEGQGHTSRDGHSKCLVNGPMRGGLTDAGRFSVVAAVSLFIVEGAGGCTLAAGTCTCGSTACAGGATFRPRKGDSSLWCNDAMRYFCDCRARDADYRRPLPEGWKTMSKASPMWPAGVARGAGWPRRAGA